MKSLKNIIIILFITLINFSLNAKSILNPPLNLNLEYSKLPQNSLQVLGITFGCGADIIFNPLQNIYDGPTYSGDPMNPELGVANVKYLNLGLKLYARNENKFSPHYTFDLVKLDAYTYKLQNDFFQYYSVSLMNFENSIFSLQDFQWINLKTGLGTSILQAREDFLHVFGIAGLGYSTFEPNNESLTTFYDKKFNNIKSFEADLSTEAVILLEPTRIELNYKQRWLFGASIMNIEEISTKFYYKIYNSNYSINPLPVYRIVSYKFSLYLELIYSHFSQDETYFNSGQFKIGIDYYLNNDEK